MKKRKTKKDNKFKQQNTSITEARMVEIHAEAYYRALKRIEKDSEKNKKSEKGNDKWYIKFLFAINIFLWPWKINKRFKVNNQIYDSILVLVVSGAMTILGGISWCVGIWSIISNVVKMVVQSDFLSFYDRLLIGVYLLLFGSIFILSGKEFGKEEDSNKIYAYSASFIALVSCIISILSML